MSGIVRPTNRLLRTASVVGALVVAIAPAKLAAGSSGNAGSQSLWTPSQATVSNAVVSSPTTGGGYPQNFPTPGGCRLGSYNANHSESEIAVKPGTETLVGTSKFFFEQFSTFYGFHVGSYSIPGSNPSATTNNIVQGYECVTTGTQAMPPSWTDTTDPNVDFDTLGRAYQTMLPFNAFWTNLHPNGEITVSFSDDLGAHWTTGNGGKALEMVPNSSSFSLHFEDKQWIAVNHFPGSTFQDHVYSVWDLGNSGGNATEVREATSRDRGLTFSPAQTVGSANVDQKKNGFPIAAVGPDSAVFIAWNNFGNINQNTTDFFVTRSTDDATTFSSPVRAASTTLIANGELNTRLPNTTFRDGVPMGFAASADFPGHLYMAFQKVNGATYDVFFTQSTDGGLTWSTPMPVNDPATVGDATDQFQPQVAIGAGGAVAVGFYDRRAACPKNDPSIIPQDQGRTNFCINLSVQAFKDAGMPTGAVAVGANIRASKFTWDPQQPGLLVNPDGTTTDLQTLGGEGQSACPKHADPCPISFIGDYFGMAISGTNIYTLSVSTHYASNVPSDQKTTLYYQQQVLATINRMTAGIP
jgi:hypothetical protein